MGYGSYSYKYENGHTGERLADLDGRVLESLAVGSIAETKHLHTVDSGG